MSSVRDKRTSLEYGYRASVSPGKSFQDFQRTVPYQWIDNNFSLKHSEYKAPYSVGVEGYEDMEYQADYTPNYPGPISFPDIPRPKFYPTLPIWQAPAYKKVVSPYPAFLHPVFTYPAFIPPKKPPRAGNKQENPNAPKLEPHKTGLNRNLETWEVNRREPGSAAVNQMRAYSNFHNFSKKIIEEKPLPGGRYSHRFLGSPAWQAVCSAAATIGYVSQQMGVNDIQSFTVVGGSGEYTWGITSGGGSITSGGIYTAPASNAECANNPTISLKCNGVEIATLALAVTASVSGNATRECTNRTCPSCATQSGYCGSCTRYLRCDGTRPESSSSVHCECIGWAANNDATLEWETCAQKSLSEGFNDVRTAGQITAGCCPQQLL